MINCFNFGLELEKSLDMTACVVFIPLSDYLKGKVIKWQKKNFSRGGSRNTSIPWGFIRLDSLRIE